MSETATLQWMLDRLRLVTEELRLGERIYPDKAPKGTGNPALIWQVIGGEQPDITDAGAVTSGRLDVQLRFYAGQRYLAAAGRETLRELFQNVEPVTDGPVRIEGTSWAHGGDTFEEKTEDYGALAILSLHWSTAASG